MFCSFGTLPIKSNWQNWQKAVVFLMDKDAFQLPQLEWIRAFEAAARCGSFTAAASETGLTQPAISQRISNLEHQLGAKLFIRNARTISLTVEGEAWLPIVTSALAELRDGSEALFARGRETLVVSASQSIITLWLLPRLRALQDATGAKFSFQSMVLGGQSAVLDDVIQIRYGNGDWPHHYRLPLYREVLAPVAAPDLVASGADWGALPRIAYSGPRPTWVEFAGRFGLPVQSKPIQRFDTFVNAHDAAVAGHGVLLGSLPLCANSLDRGSLIRLSSETLTPQSTYWLLATKDAVGRRQWEQLAGVMREETSAE
jgi:LysR family glycine cleavage system transcriptional activator